MCYKEYVRKYGTNTVTLPHFRYLTITPASRIYTLQNPSHKSQHSNHVVPFLFSYQTNAIFYTHHILNHSIFFCTITQTKYHAPPHTQSLPWHVHTYTSSSNKQKSRTHTLTSPYLAMFIGESLIRLYNLMQIGVHQLVHDIHVIEVLPLRWPNYVFNFNYLHINGPNQIKKRMHRSLNCKFYR